MVQKAEAFKLNNIFEALEAIQKGEILIVVDDEDRENEGDFFLPAEKATPETINFMATHGRGLICAPILESRCKELQIPLMTQDPDDIPMETAFCVSVDRIKDCTTGISASDRHKTIQSLIGATTVPQDFRKPGHTFPLMAREGGVLRRPGHTEAAIDLSRLAGLYPAGVIVEIMNEDGTMARMKDLIQIAKRFNLKIISIEDLIKYRIRNETLIKQISSFEVETSFGRFQARIFKQINNGQIHLSLSRGIWTENDIVAVKVDSNIVDLNFYNIFSLSTHQRYQKIFRHLSKYENSTFIMMNRNIDVEQRDHFFTDYQTYESHTQKSDQLDIGIGTQIIRSLNIRKIQLLHQSKNQRKINLHGYGVEVIGEEFL